MEDCGPDGPPRDARSIESIWEECVLRKSILTAATAALALGVSFGAANAEKIKIALIEGLSGPFAANGQAALRELEFATNEFINGKNIAGGIEVEVIGLDGQVNPKETLVQLQNAISQGVTYVVQGNSSGVAHAIVDALSKHNERNPDSRVLFLNHSAVDPALTNEKCSFWHFRFDGNADMKMNAITETIKADKSATKVYIIGQDYSFGKAVSASAKDFLGKKRPDLQVVGDELHPIGKVKDFTPYVQKIQAAGADTIITGNWGSDMVNLAKSISDLGVKANIYTFYAAGTGITGTIGASGKDKVFVVGEGRINPPGTPENAAYIEKYRAKYNGADPIYSRLAYMVQMLGKAMDKAKSGKPIDVAKALEGMEHTTLAGDKVVMRAEDHQLQMPLQIFVHTNENIKYDYDKSGFGLLEKTSVPSAENQTATTCSMQRPS
jgi:branched-chain amino acid transport system substrate-binding protein